MVRGSTSLTLSLFFFLLLHWCPTVQAQTNFIAQTNFSSIHLSGNATVIPDVGIRLTDLAEHVKGRAVYSQPLRIKDETFSFSTTFVFCILPPSDISLAGDGLAFIIAPHPSQNTALDGLYLGLFDNFTSMGHSYNHLFAVEFDIVQNDEFNDINSNHVGVDLNSLISQKSQSAGYWIGNQSLGLDLKSGHNIQAWIEYDHVSKELNVTVAPAGSLRPEIPLISMKNLTLSDILEEEMYVGFSAATGLTIEGNYILTWSFSTNGTAPALNTSMLPCLLQSKSKSPKLPLIAGFTTGMVVFLLLAVAVMWFKRKKSRDPVEEWEVEYWPHRFSYRDLATATKGFREEQVIGCGGFGKVYKGVLCSNGLEVAVKCLLRESSEGVKEFIAEISSLGRLQHRNLVQIRGYCRRGKQLFIVYDFMPNGSLEKLMFGNPGGVLRWAQRYRILWDVAAGLLYLHQGWEQRVVHRDIKSSNVLLDSQLRGKLGDFGLARLYRHDDNYLSTCVMGTPGYIAPEVGHRGRATPESDVFSFGVLMLEVACGRRPVTPFPDAPQIGLLDWLRELHTNNKVMDAADPKLNGEYLELEMERMLRLGLLCCNPRPEARPPMRQVVQILEGEASFISLSVEKGKPSSSIQSSYKCSTDTYYFSSLEGR
ncbi:L-type lectin-domain containing receptor kinase SIT2 [Cryptomeria japonica]|uniref:L-type lectin-domain containing receptor kinase SIT2 n=1 Tax=Cryptomeria japonica TaxID=3369 RepID=UPI0027DA4784|nr:L-type lectin-domain containing receptor kinase SIT2 [Cryptomeria japonica]